MLLLRPFPATKGEGMHTERALEAIAAKQHGLITAVQARTAGLTRKAIETRRTSERWVVRHRGVYAIAGVARSWEQDVLAAVLAFGPHAAASSITAASICAFIEDRGRPIHVAVPPGLHRTLREGVVVHQAALLRTDLKTVNCIRVTAPNRTLVDVAAARNTPLLEDALDTAVLRGLTSLNSLRRYILDRDLGHRPGVGALNRLIDDRALGIPESKLERIFCRKLKASGLPAPTRQFRVGRRRIDISYPDDRVIVELDGQGSRYKRAAFRADKHRQNEVVLGLPGWTLLRFTWDDVVDDWPYVEMTLRLALAA
jgi:very-short-patch-repair endonuclease